MTLLFVSGNGNEHIEQCITVFFSWCLCAVERSRVSLSSTGADSSDYINASYIMVRTVPKWLFHCDESLKFIVSDNFRVCFICRVTIKSVNSSLPRDRRQTLYKTFGGWYGTIMLQSSFLCQIPITWSVIVHPCTHTLNRYCSIALILK